MALPSNKVTLFPSADMSQATLNSDPMSIEFSHSCAVAASYTGSPNGTLTIQVTIDGNTWVSIPDTAVTVSGAGSWAWNLRDLDFPAIRLNWTKTSGTGTLSAWAYCKGVAF